MNAATQQLCIEAQALTKEFALVQGQAPKRAVDAVSFHIDEGERVGFIGRNGAGKTTLLQMLAGIADATSGTLRVNGKVTAIFTLGMALREDLTGLENIFVEGELQGRTREQSAVLVEDIVAFAELGDFIDRPVRTYSTGMKARLAFSTIVHIDPEILIVDEALSVGDSRFAAKATAKMRELTRRGRILILVSHSMGAIEDMCTRCIWIDAGQVRMDGKPSDVTRAYVDEVRKADEAKLAARFRRNVVDESLLDGWAVADASMRSTESVPVQTLVTGQPAAFCAQVRVPNGQAFGTRLRVQRLDGLAILDAAAGFEAQSQPGPTTRHVRADFGALVLNFGLYRVELQVRDASSTLAARRSTLFEVVNPRPHRGGRPVLVYPNQMTVHASTG
jgi:lipopolysaccharide transport system ATP-binding protein